MFKWDQLSELSHNEPVLFTYSNHSSTIECNKCHLPCLKPVEHIQCEAVYCFNCVKDGDLCFKNECNKPMILELIKTRAFLKLFDEVIVCCNECGRNDIKRSMFLNHFNNECLMDCPFGKIFFLKM